MSKRTYSGKRSLKGFHSGRPEALKFQSEHFNEFCLQWFSNLSIEDLRKLSADELFNIQPKNISKWVKYTSLDEKLVLLAKTGAQYFLVAGKENGWKSINSRKSIFQQYYKQGSARQEVIDLLVEEKTFVLASQAVMIAAFYMHQNCDSDMWRLNKDFQRTYTIWELTKQKIGKSSGGELDAVTKGVNIAVEFAFHINRNNSYHANLGLGSHADLIILLFMYRKTREVDAKNTFLSAEHIYEGCNDGSYKMSGFGIRLGWLAKNGYLRKMPTDKRPRYCIGDLGVQVVLEYIKKISELTKFYID